MTMITSLVNIQYLFLGLEIGAVVWSDSLTWILIIAITSMMFGVSALVVLSTQKN